MITIQVRILTLAAAILFGALAGVTATAPVDACSPPYQEGKHYAIGDWVSSPSSIVAASAATGDNRISCSPPGVDGCPQSGFFNAVDRSDAHNQKYNYQCNSLDTLCSDDNYAPGTMFSGMAWSMMENNPCSTNTAFGLGTSLRMSNGLDKEGIVSGPNLISRRLQSKAYKTCDPTSAPSAKPTNNSTSPRPTSQPTLKPTVSPSVPPTSTPTITFQPTRSKSGKPSRPPVSKLPSTNSPTKARSIRCLYPRSARFPKTAELLADITIASQTTNVTEIVQAAIETEIVQATNNAEIVPTANETEILRHRPHLAPTDGLVQ